MDDLNEEQRAVEAIDTALADLPDASEVYAALSRKAKYAVETMSGLLYSANENVKLAAARDILDRAGFKPIDRKDITSGGEVIKAPAVSDEQLMSAINGFLKRTAIDAPGREVKPAEGNIQA